MQRWLILFLALSLAACTGLPYHAKPPKVSVVDVEIKSLGIFEQHFDVGLRVSNPNDFALAIEALEFDLEVNGRAFAKGLSGVTATIPAFSSTVIRLDAITQSRNLIQQFKTLPADSLREGVPYRIVGRVKTDRSSRWIPFDHKGLYGSEGKSAKGKAI